MRIVARCPPTFLPERQYIHDVLLADFLGLAHRLEPVDAREVELVLEGDEAGRRLVVPDVLFQVAPDDWLTERALPRMPLRWCATPDHGRLPLLFDDGSHGDAVLQPAADGLRLALDVFGSAFFMLTRYEELVVPSRDQHGRFPAAATLACRAGFTERPIVNEYVELLWVALSRLWPGLERRRRHSRVTVTHDVDVPLSLRGKRPNQVLRTVAGDVVRRRDARLAARRAREALRRPRADRWREDPAFTFDFLMQTSERFGLRSSFNFMSRPGGRYPALYSLDEPWARALLREIHHRGHRLGLHVSYDAFGDAERTRSEFEQLTAVACAEGITQSRWGGRQHYLRWQNPTTWQDWEDAGLDFDSTVGFAEGPGFRCGVCYPFRVFNLRRRAALRLEERPLLFMETSLFNRNVRPHDAIERAIALHHTCRRYGGELVLLWHNDSLAARPRRVAYVELLERVS